MLKHTDLLSSVTTKGYVGVVLNESRISPEDQQLFWSRTGFSDERNNQPIGLAMLIQHSAIKILNPDPLVEKMSEQEFREFLARRQVPQHKIDAIVFASEWIPGDKRMLGNILVKLINLI